jgi:hypothetical protein
MDQDEKFDFSFSSASENSGSSFDIAKDDELFKGKIFKAGKVVRLKSNSSINKLVILFLSNYTAKIHIKRR